MNKAAAVSIIHRIRSVERLYYYCYRWCLLLVDVDCYCLICGTHTLAGLYKLCPIFWAVFVYYQYFLLQSEWLYSAIKGRISYFTWYILQIYRHGDRSPTRTFPTDKHQENSWPQGFGQLTQVRVLNVLYIATYCFKKNIFNILAGPPKEQVKFMICRTLSPISVVHREYELCNFFILSPTYRNIVLKY